MSNVKYTSDGRKVSIVGKLNSEETIVQEIFISEGNEIPSGEQFVVKSLHDAPAKSWKEKKLEDLEEQYNNDSKYWDEELLRLNNTMKAAQRKAELKIESLNVFSKNAENEDFKLLADFLSGKITHYAVLDEYNPQIISMDSNEGFVYDSRYDGSVYIKSLKLVSLEGGPDSSLIYKINTYSDGSGNSYTIIPCYSYQHALEKLQEYADERAKIDKRINIKNWMKIEGITIPEKILQNDRDKNIKSLTKQIEEAEKLIEQTKKKLKKLES